MAIMFGRSDKSKCYKESIFNVILGKKALKTIPLNANSYATEGDPALTGVDFLSKFSWKKSRDFKPSIAELQDEWDKFHIANYEDSLAINKWFASVVKAQEDANKPEISEEERIEEDDTSSLLRIENKHPL